MLAARCFCIEMSEAPRSRFPPISAFSCEKLGKMDTERYEAASTKRLSTAKTFRASAFVVADNYRDYAFIDSDRVQISDPINRHPSRDRFRERRPSVIAYNRCAVSR